LPKYLVSDKIKLTINYKSYMGEIPRNFEEHEEVKFGQNVSVEIEFMRHEEPGKTPEGMSADYLTDKGQEKAAAKGTDITKPVKAYASPKLRAQQTVDLAISNVDEGVEVINQKLAQERTATTLGQKPENEFLIRLRKELDVAKDFAKIMPEAQTWAKQQIADGSKRTAYDLIVQYYLNNPKRAEELGVVTPEESAEKIAFAADREIRMTPRLYNDSDIKLLNGTHGPNLEPFLREVMVGFKSLEEIGGALNPGEGFKFISKTDGSGNQTVKLLLRGQEYDVDMERLGQLAVGYKEKLETEKS
jgi:hypothetical protein